MGTESRKVPALLLLALLPGTAVPQDLPKLRVDVEAVYSRVRAAIVASDYAGFMANVDRAGNTLTQGMFLGDHQGMLNRFPELSKTRLQAMALSGDWAGYYPLMNLEDPQYVDLGSFKFHRVAGKWLLSSETSEASFPTSKDPKENQAGIAKILAENPNFKLPGQTTAAVMIAASSGTAGVPAGPSPAPPVNRPQASDTATRPLPAYAPLPPGFVLNVGGGQVAVERGRELFDYKDPANRTIAHITAIGHAWLRTAKLVPAPATRLDQAAVNASVRQLLVAQHWTILQEDPWIVAKRTQSGVESWLQYEGTSDFLRIKIVEVSGPSRFIPVEAPGTSSEALDHEPTYLGHFPGSLLKSAKLIPDLAIEILVPGEKESHWVGRPVYQAEYTGPSGLSPFEFTEAYSAALQKTGWKILKNTGGYSSGDASVWVRYSSATRDLWADLHVTNAGYTVKLADAGRQAEQSQLKKELDANGHVAIYGIYFDSDSSTIKPESEAALGQVLKLLAADPALKLGIEGHTDNTGARPHNQTLSETRAASVKRWLVEHKIDAARLTTAGFADTKPVADNSSPSGRAKNRRVELVKH